MVMSFHVYKQRIREADFDADPQVSPEGTTATMNVEPDEPLLPPKHPKYEGKATVVFDLDETLVYSRDGPLFARPGFQRLLAFTCLFFETVVWTAGTREYAEAVISSIDPRGAIQHCVYRHDKWYQDDGPKNLHLLGRNLDDVIMIENNPDSIRGNESNCVLVEDYDGPAENDLTLYALQELLEGIARARVPIPQYLKDSQHLRHAPPEESDPSWRAYYIDPTALSRSPRELDLTLRLGWAMHVCAAHIRSRLPELPAAAPEEKTAVVAGRWRPTASSESKPSRSRRHSKQRKGKGRRHKKQSAGPASGLHRDPVPHRPKYLVTGRSPLLSVMETALPVKDIWMNCLRAARMLMSMVY